MKIFIENYAFISNNSKKLVQYVGYEQLEA